MKDLHTLIAQIVKLTTTINTFHPELYKFLDEDPITLPILGHPVIDGTVMEEYRDGLSQLLKTYLKTHDAQ